VSADGSWAGVWLAIIALSTLVMAVIQVGAIVVGARAARRIETTIGRVEQDLKPILEQANRILEQGHLVSTEAARMSALATQQVERVDQVFSDLSRRVDQTAAVIQQALVAPAREGAALISALRSTFAAIRGLRGGNGIRPGGRSGPPRGVEEDDALFIG
jgi:hypothetical protein